MEGQVGFRNQRALQSERAVSAKALKAHFYRVLENRVSTEGTLTADGDFHAFIPGDLLAAPPQFFAINNEVFSVLFKCYISAV